MTLDARTRKRLVAEGNELTHRRIKAERMRKSLEIFTRAAWKVIEPKAIDWNWHHSLICRHLEAATKGIIQKLIINIPPRCMKSRLVSVFWPAWIWTRNPGIQFLSASYGADLSRSHARLHRELVKSDWFMKYFGRLEVQENLENWEDLTGVELAPDQTAQSRFSNEAGGYRVSGSIGGKGTGEGGDILVLDDPIKARDAQRERRRQEVKEWIGDTWSTRHNDPKSGVDVVIMQRLHPDDPTDYLLDTWEDVVHVVLPMRFEPDKKYQSHWGSDPRTEQGELLHPSRMPEPVVAALERSVINSEAQLQQEPVVRGAGQVNRGMFDIVEAVPNRGVGWARYWDKAGTEGGQGSATAGVLVGVHYESGDIYIGDVVRGRWEASEREDVIKQTAKLDAKRIPPIGPLIFTEQEPGSGGKESAQATTRNLGGFAVFSDRPTGSKAVRAQPFIAQAQAGNVYLLDGDWNETFLKEMDRWSPLEADDCDQMDGAAGAYNNLWKDEYVLLALRQGERQNLEEVISPSQGGDMFEGFDGGIIGSFIPR